MRKKNDMYLEIKHLSRRRDYKRGKGGKNKKVLSVLVTLFLVFGLGMAGFLSARARLLRQDNSYVQGQNQKKLAEEQKEGILQEEEKQESVVSETETNEELVENNYKFTENTIWVYLKGMPGLIIMSNPLNTFQTLEVYETLTELSIQSYVYKGREPSQNTVEAEEVFMPGYIDERTPAKVRGIYVTGPRAGLSESMQELIDLVDTTELNAMVIDIKNDSGLITYNMDLPIVQEIGTFENYIPNIKELITELKSKDIYLIARVVAFKDPILAEQKPELSIKNSDGTIFRDKAGHSWVNPYKRQVWEYLIDISKEAALLGFDEIQFDYIRFSTDSRMKNVDFGEDSEGKSKIDIITEFTKYAAEQLKPLGVYVSADVYGTIIDSKVDAEIVGQNYADMAKYLDYICPMIYPSHYADGTYGIQHPDLEPYNLILKSLQKSVNALEEINEDSNDESNEDSYEDSDKAIVRPWLQDFTAVWLSDYKTYGPDEIRAQVEAVYDAGYEEWILWNGSNNYTEGGLLEE